MSSPKTTGLQGSLRIRFALIFGALAIVPLLAVSVIVGRWTFGNLEDHAAGDQQEFATKIGWEVEAVIAERVNELALLDRAVGLGEMSFADQGMVVRGLIAIQPMYKEVSVVGPSGEEYVHLAAESVVLPQQFDSHGDDQLFTRALAANLTQFGPVEFDDELREPVMRIAYPVADPRSGQPREVLIATISFKPVWDLLGSLELEADRDVYITNAAHQVIAHRDPTVVLSEALRRVDTDTTNGIGLSGQEAMIGVYPIELHGATLTVVSEQHRASALALAATGLRATYVVTALALILVALAVVVVTRKVVRPIERVASSAQRVAAGDLQVRVPAAGNGEVRQLADSFNQMTLRLKDVIDSLEYRVSERTRELEIALGEHARLIAELEAGNEELLMVQEQLENMMRSKDEFLGSVSHELRTPLTSVVGYAALIRDNAERFDQDEIDEMVRLITAEATDMADIINDLLVAARVDGGSLVIEPIAIDVEDSIKQVVDHLANTEIDTSHVQSAVAFADPVRLRQILRNLMVNAVRYGGDDIVVTVAGDTDRVLVEVRDNGEGIPRSHWETIFDPYQRSESVNINPASVGLGLSVSRTLARRMRGELTYRYEDNESVFTLALPAHDPSEMDPEVRAGATILA